MGIKKIIIIGISLSSFLFANWETNIQLNHIKLSDAYVKAIKANEKKRILCKQQIYMTQKYRDEMKNTKEEKIILEEYLSLVKMYCSEVAGCNCRR